MRKVNVLQCIESNISQTTALIKAVQAGHVFFSIETLLQYVIYIYFSKYCLFNGCFYNFSSEMLYTRTISSYIAFNLKRQSHDIFDFWFFVHKSTAPRPLVNTLKYFRIPFRIRGDIRPQTIEKIDSALCNIARSQNVFFG
jgi:hypothetical protein